MLSRSFDRFSDTEILLERDLAKWKDLIEEFPNQFMWGTERGGVAVWTFDPEVGRAMNRYARAFISKLDEGTYRRSSLTEMPLTP